MGFRCLLRNLLQILRRDVSSSCLLVGGTAKPACPAFHLKPKYYVLSVKKPYMEKASIVTSQ